MIGLWRAGDAGEADLESSSFLYFPYRVRQSPFEIKLDWF